ncbi:MAG: hypothetical protein ACXWWD_06480 [Chitinophagaceae bacterium]
MAMLEDIAPAISSSQKVKLRTVSRDSIEEGLAFDSHISFLPFVNYLKGKSSGSNDTRSKFYNYLIDRFEAEPSLLGPVKDSSLLDDNRDLLELLGTTLFPVVSEPEKNIFTLSTPYQFSIFNDSPSFRKLFVSDDHFLLPENATAESLKQAQCALIYEHVMEKFYGVKLNTNTDIVYPVTDIATGMKRYYKLRYDRRFIDLHLKGKLPDLHDCAVCLNTFRILDLEKQLHTMPPELFTAEGFGVWIAEDVTTQESLDAIKKVLLRQESCDPSIINELKTQIQALVGLHDVQVGLTPFVKLNNEFVLDDTCTQHGLMGKKWKAADEESMNNFHMSIGFLTERPEPMPIAVLDEQLTEMAPFLRRLWEDGMRSYLVYPVRDNNGLLGLLELASPVANQLNLDVMARLEPAMPLLSLALLKNRDTFDQRVEKLIKEKFTALQPSVEWKFAQVAWEYMHHHNDSGVPVATGNVIFDNVYPLYGAVDIRNSSKERSAAIKKDIKEQLDLVETTLDKMESLMQLPLLEGLRFKNQQFRQSVDEMLQAEDEIRINDFFENEVVPVLQHLQKGNLKVQELAENYFKLVNDGNSYLFRYRNEYEASLAAINEVVLAYLEKEEDTLQQSYPHYFEKYRTDGIEYNIYIGQSIAPKNSFDLLYLKNIRLWQLRSMAEIARITNRLTPSLPVPLQTTQLLLIHSQPISISFRKDERRFDVEGSYNIRYEVIKKRLDKVHIKGTKERLTQPGKIAMVYSNAKEAAEYQEYIQFLQSKSILNPGIENLELEELQGVSGLKALRVHINLEG